MVSEASLSHRLFNGVSHLGGMVNKYLEASTYIDYHDPAITKQAELLSRGTKDENEVVMRCFEFVRDNIKHSWDYKLNPVTCKASDVLLHGTGYCYAKSHLLAALLRKNGIPAGLCYQRLSVYDSGAPYCLHGLNAVYLKDHGWYRIDSRGNKENVNAQFCPPIETLAFSIQGPEERDLPEIWAEPLPVVTDVLEHYDDVEQVFNNLPNIQLWG